MKFVNLMAFYSDVISFAWIVGHTHLQNMSRIKISTKLTTKDGLTSSVTSHLSKLYYFHALPPYVFY